MSTALTFAERIQHAGTGTVIGVMTVFTILIILWLILVVMQYVFGSTNKKETKAEVVEAVVTQPVAKPDDTQLIAVITAAITAMFEAQGITTKFRVKSFRRTK